MASRWPTELDENNTAPPSVMVVADGDSHLQRQAMYQVQAATQLQDRGYHVESLQQPLVGRTARITIPIVVNTQAGAAAAVYTQSEPWNVERISDLRTWIAAFREESDVPVIVATRLAAPEVAALPDVAECLHLRYDTLDVEPVTESATPPAEHSAGQVLPCLKPFKWVGRDKTVCRLLWERQTSEHMPWLAVGRDHPQTFEFINTDRLSTMNATEKTLEAQALVNLAARPLTWNEMDVDVAGGKRLRMLGGGGDYFAAEHIADPDAMADVQRRLKAKELLVGIPRRGIIFATSADQDQQVATVFAGLVAMQYLQEETPAISPMLFVVKDGVIVGILESIADEALAKLVDRQTQEQPEEDDPSAPYITAVVARNNRGTEDVHLCAGGPDGMRLANGIEAAFKNVLKQHMQRDAFSGHIQIVVLENTPPAERKHVQAVLEYLRGIYSEIAKGDARYRVTLTYQEPDTASTALARQVEARPASAAVPAAPKLSAPWRVNTKWIAAVLGVGAVAVAIAVFWFRTPFPGAIDFGERHLTRATSWNRGQTSGAVYTPSGQPFATASLQAGVIVSSEYATVAGLERFIDDQYDRSDTNRLYDSENKVCRVGSTAIGNVVRTFIAVHLCENGSGRAACAEADEPVPANLLAACMNDAGSCFARACEERMIVYHGALESLAAASLTN
jgi:uncharacterized protein YtpQ (UPF0354 family)